MDFGKMKIALLIFLMIIASLDLTWSAKKTAKKKPKLTVGLKGKRVGKKIAKTKAKKITRPSAFASEVQTVLQELATANGYTKFDRCHIVPWQFLGKQVEKYVSGKMTKKDMKNFIGDVGTIHNDARYLSKAQQKTKTKLRALVKKYVKSANDALDDGDPGVLAKALYNMPSNLYPGDCGINRSIKANLDPPRNAKGNEATKQAKDLYEDYKSEGLDIVEEPTKKKGEWVKSSDNPPGGTTTPVDIEKKDA